MNVAPSLRGSVKIWNSMKEKFWPWSFVWALIVARIIFKITVILASSHFLIVTRSRLSRNWSEHAFIFQYAECELRRLTSGVKLKICVF